MNVSELEIDLGQHGLDPIIEKQADQYGRMSWQMEFQPVLSAWLGRDLTDEEIVELQTLIFENKYTSLLKSEEGKKQKRATGRRW